MTDKKARGTERSAETAGDRSPSSEEEGSATEPVPEATVSARTDANPIGAVATGPGATQQEVTGEVVEAPSRARPASSMSVAFAGVESAVKAVGGITLLVAAAGVPALCVELRRLGLPIHLVSQTDVLRAGVIPAALIFGIAWYVAWARNQTLHDAGSVIAASGLVTAPLLIPAVAIAYIGEFGLSVVAIRWLMASAISCLTKPPSDRVLLSIAAFFSLGVLINTGPKIAWFFRRIDGFMKRARRGATRNGQATEPPDAADEEDWFTPPLWLIALLAPLLFGLALYLLRAVAVMWSPDLVEVLSTRRAFYLGAVAAAIYVLFMAMVHMTDEWTRDGGWRRVVALTLAMMISLLPFVGALYGYVVYGYRSLPQSLGGGRAERHTIVLERDPYMGVAKTSTGSTQGANTRPCDLPCDQAGDRWICTLPVLILEKHAVLIQPGRPVIAVPIDDIKAVSGGPLRCSER